MMKLRISESCRLLRRADNKLFLLENVIRHSVIQSGDRFLIRQ